MSRLPWCQRQLSLMSFLVNKTPSWLNSSLLFKYLFQPHTRQTHRPHPRALLVPCSLSVTLLREVWMAGWAVALLHAFLSGTTWDTGIRRTPWHVPVVLERPSAVQSLVQALSKTRGQEWRPSPSSGFTWVTKGMPGVVTLRWEELHLYKCCVCQNVTLFFCCRQKDSLHRPRTALETLHPRKNHQKSGLRNMCDMKTEDLDQCVRLWKFLKMLFHLLLH